MTDPILGNPDDREPGRVRNEQALHRHLLSDNVTSTLRVRAHALGMASAQTEINRMRARMLMKVSSPKLQRRQRVTRFARAFLRMFCADTTLALLIGLLLVWFFTASVLTVIDIVNGRVMW